MEHELETFKKPSPHFPFEVAFLKTDSPIHLTDEERSIASIPESGLGTVYPKSKSEAEYDRKYLSFALFLTGFVLLFPWLLCGFFIRSKQEVPRYMGILSIMLFPATLMLIGFYLRTWKVVV